MFSDGGMLEVKHCWFEGFDRTIEVDANARIRTRIEQTMIVPEPCKDPAQVPLAEWFGWGVKLNFAGTGLVQAGDPPAHLILDHCTVEGGGLLDLTNSKGPGPVQVEVDQCVVRTNALLAVKPASPPAAQIGWHGKGNHYDIQGQGRYWIVLSATHGTPAFSSAVTDLKSWLSSFTTDATLIRGKVKFQTDPEARPSPLRPQDFAIEAAGPAQSHPGADPTQVGPGSKPASLPAVTIKDK